MAHGWTMFVRDTEFIFMLTETGTKGSGKNTSAMVKELIFMPKQVYNISLSKIINILMFNFFFIFLGSKYVGLWRKGKMTGHGEIIHFNHKLVSKFKENHVIFILILDIFEY